MRTIKFRGKRVDNSEWVYGGIKFIDGRVFVICKQGNTLDFSHEVTPESVVQFTGLLDNNGREIYDGDSINVIEFDGDEIQEYTTDVKYEESAFVVKSFQSDGDYDVFLSSWYGGDNRYPAIEFVVIGNIHD